MCFDKLLPLGQYDLFMKSKLIIFIIDNTHDLIDLSLQGNFAYRVLLIRNIVDLNHYVVFILL